MTDSQGGSTARTAPTKAQRSALGPDITAKDAPGRQREPRDPVPVSERTLIDPAAGIVGVEPSKRTTLEPLPDRNRTEFQPTSAMARGTAHPNIGRTEAGPTESLAMRIRSLASGKLDQKVQAAPAVRPMVVEGTPRKAASPLEPSGPGRRQESSAPIRAILAPERPPNSPLAPHLQPSEAKSAEPVIHVTIGRVEVRAVPAAPAPKRAAPSAPSLSLGEYLRRRDGGSG